MNPDPEPPADAAPTHDDLVKGLLSQPRLLVEFFRAFVPEVLEFADFSEAEYLDKEHGRSGKRPRRVGDLLVKAKWRGQDAAFLIHLESQAKAQRFALERVAEYALRDSIRYGLPVMPVLLLTYAKPERPEPGELDWTFGEVAFLRVRCPVLHFRLMDPAPYLAGGNVAALALTSLMRLEPGQQVEAIVQTLAQALRQGLGEEEMEAAAAFVRHYAPLDADQLLQLRERVRMLSEENESLNAMPTLVNPFVEIGKLEGLEEGLEEGLRRGLERGRAEGMEKGIEKGRTEGERHLTLRLVERKFPGIAAEVAGKLTALDEEELLAFGEALLFFESEADCLAWFDRT